MPTSPTQRSLKNLRGRGWTVGVVEKWNAHIRCRQDLFGFADLLAFHETVDCQLIVALVQTTSGSNLAARRTKILANEYAQRWMRLGGKILLHGWAKRGPRGKRKVWTLREEVLDGCE